MNKEVKNNFFKNILISVFAILINFSFRVILSNNIEKETLGIYFTVIDIFTLSLLIAVGFRSSMIVSFAKLKDDKKILNIFRLCIIILVLISWAFIIPYIKHGLNVKIHYWYLVASIISMSLNSYMTNQLAMYRHYKTINEVNLLEPILNLLWFIIAFYIANTKGLKPLFISTIMSSICLSIFIYYKKTIKVKEPPFLLKLDKDMKIFLKNSLISSLEFGSGIIMSYIAVILIMKYFTMQNLADYQVVVKPIFNYMIILFIFPIFKFILPELSILIVKKDFIEIRNIKMWIYKLSFTVSILFLLFTINFSKEIILYFFSYQYYYSYLMLVHLSFFFIFVILNAYQISFIKANGKFFWALTVRIIGILCLVLIFYILELFSSNVINVVLALIWGYGAMFCLSFIMELILIKRIKKENSLI